ncbi:MAG: hypothetical protein PHC61_04880 [Chitinivibrionales bacterium]|nr:hypothetical protein [Chitinivibrionales bacterium]
MKLKIAFVFFIVVGLCSSAMLMVLQCSSTQTIVRDKASGAELHKVEFSGGNGDSYETAVIIGGIREQRIVNDAEIMYISRIYGQENKKWKVIEQALTADSGKTYDMVKFQVLPAGENKILYFDVSKFNKKKKAMNVDSTGL